MRKVFIHKLAVTAEAKFDYEEGMGFARIPKNEIAKEVEGYLGLRQKDDKLSNVKYFKLKYYDDTTGEMLWLFIRKDIVLVSIQTWLLVGLCKEEDWTEDLEHDGVVRGWLKTDIEELVEEDDWVEVLRDDQAEQKRIMEEME